VFGIEELVREIKAGDMAPDFDLPTDGNFSLCLSNLRGKNVILYFYPRDHTPGCTLEAQVFASFNDLFESLNTVVIGVSKDTPASHDKFKLKHKLPFTLVSDEKKLMCTDYGVLKEKNMFGKSYMGIERSTFLIDTNGIIRKIWKKVGVKGHIAEVLAAIRDL
jgi:thioredoxin-dependent peroxiredoxin